MPNIDELAHDHKFTVGGETFEVHDVHPSVILAIQKAEMPAEEEEQLKQLDKQIESFLNGDPEAVKRWRALRKRTTDPLPIWKIVEFNQQLVETQYRRPTGTPSPSVSGPGQTAPSSGAE